MEFGYFFCSLWEGGGDKGVNSEVVMKKRRLIYMNIFIWVDVYFEVKEGKMRTNK